MIDCKMGISADTLVLVHSSSKVKNSYFLFLVLLVIMQNSADSWLCLVICSSTVAIVFSEASNLLK